MHLLFFILYCLVLLTAFRPIGMELARLSLSDSLSSYVLVIPVVSGVLLFRQWKSLAPSPCQPPVVALFLLAGFIGILGAAESGTNGLRLNPAAGLPALVFAMISFFIAGFAGWLGQAAFTSARFPLLFLYFMTPIPPWLESLLTTLLQYGSATLTYLFLKFTIFPVYWEDTTIFTLPGLTLHVAEECSGIRSTLILLVSAMLTGHLLLRSNRARVILLLLVLPIGILRNTLRIWSLSLLTVYVDPAIMTGALHRQGGALFFALSLALLLAAAFLLRRADDRRKPGNEPP